MYFDYGFTRRVAQFAVLLKYSSAHHLKRQLLSPLNPENIRTSKWVALGVYNYIAQSTKWQIPGAQFRRLWWIRTLISCAPWCSVTASHFRWRVRGIREMWDAWRYFPDATFIICPLFAGMFLAFVLFVDAARFFPPPVHTISLVLHLMFETGSDWTVFKLITQTKK